MVLRVNNKGLETKHVKNIDHLDNHNCSTDFQEFKGLDKVSVKKREPVLYLPGISYPAGIISCPKEEIEATDVKKRKPHHA